MSTEIIQPGEYHFKDHVPNAEMYEEHYPEGFSVKDVTPDEFSKCLIENALRNIRPRTQPFEIDEKNREVFEQLYYYLVKDSKFNGDLQKGIALTGPYGSGKTLLLKAFSSVLSEHAFVVIPESRRRYDGKTHKKAEHAWVGSREIMKTISNGMAEYFIYQTSGFLFIDDFGKEPLTVNDYGTKTRPMEEVIEYRYTRRLLTFATTNFKLGDLPYSGHTSDRLRAMMNFIPLLGDSRRK